MLSTDDVPPPDPLPCHNDDEISQLKSGSSCSNICKDERVVSSGNDNQNQVEVAAAADLLKSGLDDSNPLPKFSIRDYVFNARGKDIKTHWPFSPKNLQLCMKHGVKNVLPPFQTVESMRQNSFSSVKSCAPIAENMIGNSAVKLSRMSDHVGQELDLDIEKIKSNLSEEDKEHPSTTTSLSHSGGNSAHISIKSPSLEAEAQNSQSRKPEFASSKVNKKCRLILKSSKIAEKKTNEELLTASTSVMASETMTSKVCPVCKTFASSSNTTLNAHIDQCLSVESDVKWGTNSKVIKHRIKPRKTRLMVDIYETAQRCTLEDLDRRNGTNWALNLGISGQNLEGSAEAENPQICSNNKEDNNGDKSDVYFDSNGRKVRILSKFSDQQLNANSVDDYGLKKLEKRDKESKKKKYFAECHKVVRHDTYGGKGCSSTMPDHCLEVTNGHQQKLPTEEDEEDFTRPSRACDQTKSNAFGTIKQWVGSTRSGLKKKTNIEHDHNRNPKKIIKSSRAKSNLPLQGDNLTPKISDSSFPVLRGENPNKMRKCLRAKRNLPSQGDNLTPKISDSSFPVLRGETPLLATGSHKSKENLSLSNPDEHMEPIRLRKREGSFLLESSSDSLVRSKSNRKQSKKDGVNSNHKCIMDLPNVAVNNESSRSNQKIKSINSTINCRSSSLMSSRTSQYHTTGIDFKSLKKTSSSAAFFSRSKKLSSLRKDLLSVKRTSVSESKKCLGRNFKKRRWHYMSESDEGIRNQDKTTVETLGEEEVSFVNSGKEGDIGLNRSDASLGSNGHGGSKSIVLFEGVDVPEVEIHDELVRDLIPRSSDVAGFTAFDEPLDVHDAEMIPQKHYLETDSNEGQQGNYFVDVDPIPIPGPPGSFLPSPGRMPSEEILGNSSITTCRMHSSEDEHELIDMESSISPISGTLFNTFAASSEIFTKSEPTQQLEKVVANSQEYTTELVSHMSFEANFPTRGDTESISPSSNPVLRLMGKNLMVVNNKEEMITSPQTRFSDNVVGLSHIRIQSEHYRPFISNNAEHFDFKLSNGCPEIGANFKSPELSQNLSRVMISSKSSSNGGLTSSLACQEYAQQYNFAPTQQVEKIRIESSWGGKPNEIIIIDDSPENEASLAVKAMHGANTESWGPSVGISEPRALWCDSRILNPHFNYQTRGYSTRGGSQMVSNANAQLPSAKCVNPNSVVWNQSTPEGPSMLRQNSSIASTTGQTRSSMYYSPGFSLPTNFT